MKEKEKPGPNKRLRNERAYTECFWYADCATFLFCTNTTHKASHQAWRRMGQSGECADSARGNAFCGTRVSYQLWRSPYRSCQFYSHMAGRSLAGSMYCLPTNCWRHIPM